MEDNGSGSVREVSMGGKPRSSFGGGEFGKGIAAGDKG
jgi:hypothetical protein